MKFGYHLKGKNATSLDGDHFFYNKVYISENINIKFRV